MFEDPEFDGPPEDITVDEVDDQGDVVIPPDVEQPEPAFGDEVADEGEIGEQAERKFYVDDGEAFVTAEGFYLPDLETGRLRLVQYHDYVADAVRSLCANPRDLRRRWASAPTRTEVRDELARRGIDLDEAAERLGLLDADPVDILVHVAWNEPVATRRERVRRTRTRAESFLEQFVPAAREVLEQLLEKYAEHGVEQLDDLSILRVPPLRSHGTVVEIANLFGGHDELRAAVGELESQLYAA